LSKESFITGLLNFKTVDNGEQKLRLKEGCGPFFQIRVGVYKLNDCFDGLR